MKMIKSKKGRPFLKKGKRRQPSLEEGASLTRESQVVLRSNMMMKKHRNQNKNKSKFPEKEREEAEEQQ